MEVPVYNFMNPVSLSESLHVYFIANWCEIKGTVMYIHSCSVDTYALDSGGGNVVYIYVGTCCKQKP